MANIKNHTCLFSIREKFPTRDESYFSLITALKEKQLFFKTMVNSKGQPVVWWFKRVYWNCKQNKKDTTIQWLTHMLKTQYSFTWSYQDVDDEIQELSTQRLLEIYHLLDDLH